MYTITCAHHYYETFRIWNGVIVFFLSWCKSMWKRFISMLLNTFISSLQFSSFLFLNICAIFCCCFTRVIHVCLPFYVITAPFEWNGNESGVYRQTYSFLGYIYIHTYYVKEQNVLLWHAFVININELRNEWKPAG